MPLKSTIVTIAAIMIIGEILCFALPWLILNDQGETADSAQLNYIPYVFTALTIAFLAFFTLLFTFIFVLLKGEIKSHITALLLLATAFLLPIIGYITIY